MMGVLVLNNLRRNSNRFSPRKIASAKLGLIDKIVLVGI
jgi:hypothetical protein